MKRLRCCERSFTISAQALFYFPVLELRFYITYVLKPYKWIPVVHFDYCIFEENLNASRPSEHAPVAGKNVKTFRWDHRLQRRKPLYYCTVLVLQGMEKDLRQRDQGGLYQRCKFLNIEGTRKVNSQYIRDEEGIMLRDPELVLGRWARFFGTLLNSKSDKLGLDIIDELPQWPITHALGVEPTENELIGTLRSMANAKAVGPDELPVELLKLGINHDPTVLRVSHQVIKRVWHQREVSQ